jgi:2-iminobutanoate/2-iminopropanoate deaminase
VRQIVTSQELPVPGGPYSPAVIAGGLVFLSGQRPVNPQTGELAVGFAAQARQVLCNIESVLRAAGSGLDDVVRVGVHLADLASFAEFNEIYSEFFAEPYPARTTVGSALRGILVEIDAVAVTRGDNERPGGSADEG